MTLFVLIFSLIENLSNRFKEFDDDLFPNNVKTNNNIESLTRFTYLVIPRTNQLRIQWLSLYILVQEYDLCKSHMFINLFKTLLSSHSRWLSIRSMPRSCSWQISPHPSPHFVILGPGSKWRVALPHWGPQSFYGSWTNDNTNDNVHKLFRISLFSWQLLVRHVGFKPS